MTNLVFFLSGIIAGAFCMWLILSPRIGDIIDNGDDYTVGRVKQKGGGNEIRADLRKKQKKRNLAPQNKEEKGIFRKIFKKRKNGRK